MTDQFTCLFFYLVVWAAILPFMQSVRQSTSLPSPTVRELVSQPARSASQWVSHRTVIHSFIHAVSMVSLSVSQPTRPGAQWVSQSVSQSVRQSVGQPARPDSH